MRKHTHWLFLLGLILLSACSLEPRYERPPAPVPTTWPTGDAYPLASDEEATAREYHDVVRDARLATLVERALVTNRDLRVAAANVAIARAQYGVQRGKRWPEIDVGAQVKSGTTAADGKSSVGGTDSASATVGVTAFELDLFGRMRSLSRAALDRYLATESGARATRIALVGDVSKAWLNYAADRSLIRIAEDTITSARKSIELTNARLQRGVAPRSDVRQAETVLNQALVDLASGRTLLAQDRNALEFLVGEPVEENLLPTSIDEVTGSIAEVPAGIDTTVLVQRPDVVQAEYELRATNAEIGAARAALFPRISLSALVGFAGTDWSQLFTSASRSNSQGASASLPIFTGGAARAGLAQVRAQRDTAVASYERTLQVAFREVADSLARRGTIVSQEDAQRALVDATADAYQLANARYQGGVESFLQTLDSQRSMYSAERGLVQVQLTKTTNLVDLYRALGGNAADTLSSDRPSGEKP